ncbi:single-stranded DNA-binding protein [Quadrisphaera sp. GCM10027208]|uniref:single-stranded DNA-binding protein n=1 Tax=Quadrisphaera sp. GCM10027208 TaxID=3273423 RepID=UPI00361CD9BB
MLDNTVVIVGNLGANPEYRRLDNGIEVANFRVGSTRRRYDRATGQWVDGPTSWWRVTCWRGLAANVAHSLRRGERVVVVGRPQVVPWETEDGRSGTSVEVEAQAVGHDLAWGTSTFERVVRSERLDLPGGRDPETGLRVSADGEILDDRTEDGTEDGTDDGAGSGLRSSGGREAGEAVRV